MSIDFSKLFESQQPLPGNRCREQNCTGHVVQKACGLFRGILYATPACDVCGHAYPRAENAPKVGAQEFLDSLRKPTTF